MSSATVKDYEEIMKVLNAYVQGGVAPYTFSKTIRAEAIVVT